MPVRYDPFDAGVAYAFIRKRWVRCISEHHARFAGRSEREIQLASAELRRRQQRHNQQFRVTARQLADFLASVEGEEVVLQQRLRDAEARTTLEPLVGTPLIHPAAVAVLGADDIAGPELELQEALSPALTDGSSHDALVIYHDYCSSSTSTAPSASIAKPTTVLPASTAAAPAPTISVIGTWTPPPRTKTTGCLSQGGLPDPACTPGAVDPNVTQSNIASTICTRGHTATVRPPVSVTEPIKREQMAAYGLQGVRLADEELDHLVPLELGGAPQDVANLWVEPWSGGANAHMKDAVETYLNREVCRGAIPLTEAQRQIATDWLSVYRSRGLSPAQ